MRASEVDAPIGSGGSAAVLGVPQRWSRRQGVFGAGEAREMYDCTGTAQGAEGGVQEEAAAGRGRGTREAYGIAGAE